MAYEFKKLSDVNSIEGMKDGLSVLVEDGGEIVKISANSMIPDAVPMPATAEVGQVIAVKAVDEDKPTEWEMINTFSETTGKKTITFNGETEGLEVINNFYYRVNSDTPSINDLMGHSFKITDSSGETISTLNFNEVPINPSSSYPNQMYNVNNMILVFTEDVPGVASKGIYLEWTDWGRITEMSYSYNKKVINSSLIPENVPLIQSASVGQTIVVKAVDKNGKPTEWKAVDGGGSGGGFIYYFAKENRIYQDEDCTDEIELFEHVWLDDCIGMGRLAVVYDTDYDWRAYLISYVISTGAGYDLIQSGDKTFYTDGGPAPEPQSLTT